MARKVGDVMTSVPIAVPPETTLVEAARFMDEYGVGEVLVIEDGRLCGVLTDRDIGVAAERDASRTSVAVICNTDLVAVSPNDDAEIVARLMAGHLASNGRRTAENAPAGCSERQGASCQVSCSRVRSGVRRGR
jgi:CBS domain-containing protein